jgi:hypothetical protein
MMSIKTTVMAAALSLLLGKSVAAQEPIKTVFKGGLKSSGGYGALTNKFTQIRGEYANMSGLYGGWFVNHKLMIGAGAWAVTSNIPVPLQYSTDPSRNKSYEYGQVGLVTEYVVGSSKPVHLVFQLFAGAGFTLQYERHNWHNNNSSFDNSISDENWFFVAEPGVQVEVNLFKWMRFSPGVSYRTSFGSDAAGLKDKDIRDISYSATLKFGKF